VSVNDESEELRLVVV